MKNIKVQSCDLILEVTRRCNMSCEHCLRGCAQNVDMTKEIVDKALSYVSSIGCLTLTGGEPTLNMDLVRYIFEEIHRREIPMSAFYIVTNGKVNQMDLAVLALQEIMHCDEPEVCGVAISKDIFHDHLAEESPLQYLTFYRNDKEMGDYYKGDGVILRGRAENFGTGREMNPTIEFDIVDAVESESEIQVCMDGYLYISALGEVCADCDLSYDMMKDYKVGDLDRMDQLLQDAYEQYINE